MKYEEYIKSLIRADFDNTNEDFGEEFKRYKAIDAAYEIGFFELASEMLDDLKVGERIDYKLNNR